MCQRTDVGFSRSVHAVDMSWHVLNWGMLPLLPWVSHAREYNAM